jgi:hypothetical protein
MITDFTNLNQFFTEKLKDLQCQYDTKAYIISIYTKYINSETDLSKDSITLLYASAKERQDFSIFQNIGDWIFFSKTLYPKFLSCASENYYRTLGRMSYYSCYTLIRKQWKLFEELSDNFVFLENQVKKLLKT